MTRVGVITQARTTSTRLPRKVLLEVAGKALLQHHLDRLATSGLDVYVATTTNTSDDEIVSLASRLGRVVHRGSEEDVLARFHGCATENHLDIIVRVTSDCPLVDGAVVAAAVEDYLAAGDPWLYLSNTLRRSFPRGFDLEVFSTPALTDAHRHATEPPQREHVTPYLHTNANGRMHLRNLTWPEDKSAYRVTLDTPDDLRLITTLLEDHHAATLTCGQIIDLLDRNPDLAALNQHVEQKKLGE